MERKTNMVAWFEIPVVQMERAMKFYEDVFTVKLNRHPMGDLDMAFFGFVEGASGASGALIRHSEHYKPSQDGVLIYFESSDITTELDRVEKAGGKVLMPKTEIAPTVGHMALFLDSEGNRLALYSKAK